MPEVHAGSKRDLVNTWKENPTQPIKYKDARFASLPENTQMDISSILDLPHQVSFQGLAALASSNYFLTTSLPLLVPFGITEDKMLCKMHQVRVLTELLSSSMQGSSLCAVGLESKKTYSVSKA